jgi:hypothetical protein
LRLLASAGLLAGIAPLASCAPAASHPAAGTAATAVTTPLATSMTTADGATWAILAVGGSAADENLFWELFTRPQGSTRWTLATPPGVADNGGLVAAAADGSLAVSFLPSQDLTFTPLASTGDAGQSWGTGLLDGSMASVPDALAVGDGSLLALLADGAIDESTGGQPASGQAPGSQAAGSQGGWAPLAAPGAIAASPAGLRCQVTGLTAVAYTPAGTPLVATSCARPGSAGIFARAAGTWQAAGPAVPAGTAVRVVRLTRTSAGDTALLQASTASGKSLLAAWTSDGTRWTVSAPLPLSGGHVVASGTGPAGALWVLLSGDRAETLAGPGASWRELPAPPPGTVALAGGPDGTYEALAVSVTRLTIYQVTAAGAWGTVQAISVPVQYGSSS